MPEADAEKPPMDSADPSTAIPLDHRFWSVASFAAKREVEMSVRLEARHDPSLVRWFSGDDSARDAGIERLGQIRFERDRRATEKALAKYAEEAARLGEENVAWPSRILEEIPSPSERKPERPTSADRAANYLGAVNGPLHRLARREERDLLDLFRSPLHLFLPEFPIFADRDDAWRRYEEIVARRPEMCRQYGVQSNELLIVLWAIADCEELGTVCEPLNESIEAVKALLRAKAASPSTPRHVRDAYAAKRWDVFQVSQEGGSLRIDDGRTITTLSYGTECRYLKWLDVASHVLATQYRSSAEGALLFLLTSSGMGFKTARIDYQTEDRPAALARVVLTVDPTLSPDEAKELYRHARKKVIGHHQDTEEATMALAGHVYSQTHTRTVPTEDECRSGDWVDYDEGWRRLMETWNRERRDRPIPGRKGATRIYTEVSRFRRDAEEARARLMDRRIKDAPRTPEFPPLEVFEDRPASHKKVTPASNEVPDEH